MLKRVKNGQREKIMGPGTSMGSKEYKKVGLVGNVAIKKSLIFYLGCHLGCLINTKNWV